MTWIWPTRLGVQFEIILVTFSLPQLKAKREPCIRPPDVCATPGMVTIAYGPLIQGEPLLRWRAINLTEVIVAPGGKLGVAKPYAAVAGVVVLGTVKSAELPSCTNA